MAWVRMSGGASVPNILDIFNSTDGLKDGYILTGSATISGAAPTMQIGVSRGAAGALSPTIDCSAYKTLHIVAWGGYSSAAFSIRNGNNTIINVTGQGSPTHFNVDISNLNVLSLNFVGSSATGSNYIGLIELIK